MKKRLVCLLLCLVMVLSVVLASCSKKNDEEAAGNITDQASESAITLTMWVVSEEKISDANAAAVSKALNSITNSKFKIRLAMQYFTEDEYRAELEKTIIAYEEAKKQQAAVETEPVTEAESGADTAPVTDETETNEYGMTTIKYPEVLANQVDIIYIAGEDMYFDFIEKGWLAELDTELSSSSKKIKEYVSSTLLSAAKTNGTTYAVPNNCVIGEYTYMLLNKELVNKYSQTGYVQYGQIDGFYNEYLYTFLNTIYALEPNAVPIDSTYEACLELLAHYWSIDPNTYGRLDEFSVFGSHYKNMEELSRGSVILGYQSLFEDAAFTEAFLQLNKFKFGDGTRSYFDTSSADKPAAVKFLTAESTALTYNESAKAYEYVDENGVAYYPITVKYPTASSEDIYGNMFGVCKYSRSISRSMQIITYLNTNSDFRNILQYGVEKTSGNDTTLSHYEIVEDDNGNKVVHRLNEDYMMNIFATGNVFMAYPDPKLNMTADVWESGKIQNRDSLVEPMLGMDFATFSATTGKEPEAQKIPNDPGYILSYTSGYSKSLFSQNETLKAWIESCDAAGKGVYVLPTELVEGQNRTINYYVYNNAGKGTFTVDAIRETEERKDNKGKVTVVQTNLDFIFTYSDVKSDGYELSLVQLYTKKANEFELMAKVDGADTALNIAKAKELLSFDFYNTQKYTIDFYNTVPKTAFTKNDAIVAWLTGDDCGSTGYFQLWDKTEENGKNVWTYVVLDAGLKYVTSSKLITTGEDNTLNLELAYTFSEENKLDSSEANYILHYIRVTADKGVDVTLDITENGAKKSASKTEGACDYDMIGNLDTELVKYLYTLNADIVAALNACKTYEELAAMVDGLQVLLATKGSSVVLSDDQKAALAPILMDGEENKYDLYELAAYLKAAVATETVLDKDEEGNVIPDSVFTSEEPYGFDSPNTIYYKWLAAYGYKPK